MIKPKKAGRPPLMTEGTAIKVYLDADAIATANILGDGNTSKGIRRALKRVKIVK